MHNRGEHQNVFLEHNQIDDKFAKIAFKGKNPKPPMPENVNRRMNSGNRIPRSAQSGNHNNRNESNSAEKIEKRMTPYFKKMANQYNPKYREKSNEKFNRIKSEVEIKLREECSFKPKLSDFANKMENKNESKDDLYKRLATPKSIEIQKRQKEKEAKDANTVRFSNINIEFIRRLQTVLSNRKF